MNGDPRREEINVIGEAETNKRPLGLWLRLEVYWGGTVEHAARVIPQKFPSFREETD